MKKVIAVLLLAAMGTMLFGCSDRPGETVSARGIVFEAVVKEVNEESILVMPVAGTDEAGVAMDIGLLVMKSDKIPEVRVGDKVRIDYDGVITRSIPGQLGEVYRFEVIQ